MKGLRVFERSLILWENLKTCNYDAKEASQYNWEEMSTIKVHTIVDSRALYYSFH